MGSSSSVLSTYRDKLNKEGKRLLDDYVTTCAELSEEEQYDTVKLKIEDLLKTNALPPIRFLSFDRFCKLTAIPRFPDCEDATVSLESINRDESLLVFVSHNWMRSSPTAEGWEEKPHPDDPSGNKFKLCVQGIKQIMTTMAPGMTNCYLWLDYSCLNQDKDPVEELHQLDKIMECCDLVFTPIIDLGPFWPLPTESVDLFKDYQSKQWKEGSHAYLNRGWCRVEMLYGANIPLLDNANIEIKRHTLFSDVLQLSTAKRYRPHFLYGTKEMNEKRPPMALAEIQFTFLTDYPPLKGFITKFSDKKILEILMEDLQPHLSKLNKSPSGYVGQRNGEGQRHGYGVYTYEDGSVYDGDFVNGNRQGHGIHIYTDGDVYDGEFHQNMKHGYGTYTFADGCVYQGEWIRGLKHGHGVYKYKNGDVYDGEWQKDLKHGKGKYCAADGLTFDGEYKSGKKHGKGKLSKIGRGAGTTLGYWEDGEMVKVNRSCCFWSSGIVV